MLSHILPIQKGDKIINCQKILVQLRILELEEAMSLKTKGLRLNQFDDVSEREEHDVDSDETSTEKLSFLHGVVDLKLLLSWPDYDPPVQCVRFLAHFGFDDLASSNACSIYSLFHYRSFLAIF
ncbi:hypothetical protein Tco_1489642 [Tanacetum coccineum]